MSRLLCSAVVLATTARLAAAGPLTVPLVATDRADVVRRAAPVSASVPLPRGALRDPAAVTLTVGERPLPLQSRALERWPDGSVRWLFLDFLGDVPAGSHATYTLRGRNGAPASGPRIRMEKRAGGRTLDAGPIRVSVDDAGALEIALRDGGRRVGPIPLPAVTVDGTTPTRPSDVAVAVETDGPLRTELLITARDALGVATEVRVAVFAGQPFVRLRHTVTNFADRDELAIRSLPLVVPGGFTDAAVGISGQSRALPSLVASHELVADDPAYARLDGDGVGRADGWLRASGDGVAVTLVAPAFWREYPKAFRVDAKGASLDLFAGAREPVRFGRGVAKTHELWIVVEAPRGDARPADVAAALAAPLVASPPASWVAASDALPQALAPTAPASRDFLARLASAYARYRETVRTERWDDVPIDGCGPETPSRVRVGLYGVFNWGDWQFPGLRSKTHGCEAWGNLEYDLSQVLALGWLATGSPEFYEGMVAAARHYGDVDVMHHPPPEHPGWRGMNHPHKSRHFSFATAEKVDLGHTWAEGLVTYWRLTGEVRALQAARGIADALVARHVPRGANPRQYGWPMIALVGVWDATGEARYRDKAVDYARLVVDVVPATPAAGDWKMGILADGIAVTHAATGDAQLRRWLTEYADALAAEPARYQDPRFALPLGYLARLTGDPRYAARACAAAANLKLGAWGKPLAAMGRTGFRLLAPLPAAMAPPSSPPPPLPEPAVRPGRAGPRPGSPPAPRPPSRSPAAPARPAAD